MMLLQLQCLWFSLF